MMIPITRKEKYINEIVGGGDTAPETPQTREEFFFAEILGEVIAPSPVTRVEKYLSAIAGQYSGELPEPVTRIERFIARAAGMDVTIPTPTTREEMLWANYALIVEKELSGIPPLTFKAKKAGTLKNYRIYGNTETKTRSYSGSAPLSFPIEDGAVSNYRVYGQTSRNLFEYDSEEVYSNSTLGNLNLWDYADFSTGTVLRIPCTSNTTYTLSIADDIEHSVFRISTTYLDITPPHEVQSGQTGNIQCSNLINDGTLRTATFTTSGTAKYILFQTNTNIFQNAIETLMLNVGSTGLPYEPYGESVGDRTRNILPMSTTPIDTIIDDFHCEYDGMGAIILTATKDNADFSSFTIPLKEDFIIPISVGRGGNGCVQFNNDKVYTIDSIEHADFMVCFNFNNIQIDFFRLLEVNRIHSNYNLMGGKTINNISINKTEHFVPHLAKGDKLTIRPAFYNNGTTEQVPFEPYGYKIPVTNNSETANIYLDEPLRKVGDEAEYVDYAEQKRYNADGTSEDVSLPALPAQSSTNSLSVGTSVQPSSVAVDVDEVVSCGDKVTDSQSVNYGKYKIPVTLTADSAETTDIYLDEPLAKSGNNADYIDYATQKRQNSDGTESSVTLPEISTLAGTNTLTVRTEVQPSNVYIKYEEER